MHRFDPGAYAPSHRNTDHWRVDLDKSGRAIARWGALRFLLELAFAGVLFAAIMGWLFL